MKLVKENRIFIAIIIVALLASMVVIGQRFSVEKNNRTVDVVLDFEETELLAKQSTHDISWWLSEFADMGIKKVGLHEETLESLTESDKPVKAELVTELRKDTYWMNQASSEVLDLIEENVKDDYDVLVTASSKEMYDFVKRAFTERYTSHEAKFLETELGGYILIDGNVEDSLYGSTKKQTLTDGTGFSEEKKMKSSIIMYLNLGLLPEKVELIQDAGCSVEPRVLAYANWNDSSVLDDITQQYKKLGVKPSYWIMGSKVVPGYDDGTEELTKYLKDNDVTIGIVENTTQRENISPDGMEEVISDTGYDVVRVFSVWPYIQYRYAYYGYDSYQEIENSLFRAVVERNIKVIYYKPMKETDDSFLYITDVNEYRDSFAHLEKRLERHGITIGEASPSEAYKVSLWAKMLAAIAAGCAALMCLKAIFQIKQKWLYILLGVGVVGVVGAYFVAPNAAELLTSFAVATTFPCIAVIWMLHEGLKLKTDLSKDTGAGKLILRGSGVLLIGVVICLAGAIMTAAPISSINYMLELDIFRGVKLAQLLPIAFFMIAFMIMAMYLWGKKQKQTLEVRDVKWVLNFDIKVWMILLGAIVLAAGYIYLARTGHETNVEATSLELLLRNYLEELLYARPRTKEFLVAFPAVVLFIYSLVRNMKVLSFLFGLAGVIGFTSIVNTFMHIRTPLELGFARTGFSVLFGIILGIVYTLILEGLYRLFRKRGSRNNA